MLHIDFAAMATLKAHAPTRERTLTRHRIHSFADYAKWFASQGGKARKRALTSEQRVAIARKAGRARTKKLTAKQRRASAREAAQARWAKARKKRQ